MTLLDDFNAIDLDVIEDMIARGQEEHLQLDFKTVSNANVNGTDDRRTIAKALSGFANSAGGIIVWGVVARPDPARDNLDVAIGRSLIQPAQLLVTRLNSLSGEASSPSIDGVLHKTILVDGTAGYVATLVPDSLSTPHMAKLGENRYYKRSGDSFRMMEHFDLEDMFGRRAKPKISLQIDHEVVDEEVELLRFWMRNSGRAVARFAGTSINLGENVTIVQVEGPLRNLAAFNGGRAFVGFDNDVSVVHPNGIRVMIGLVRFTRRAPQNPVVLGVTVYAEHQQAETADLQIDPPVRQHEVNDGE